MATKPSKKSPVAPQMVSQKHPLVAPAGGCAIRMYRQGFGDCFLIAFGASDNTQKYMLIDCGVLYESKDPKTRMTAVANDICSTTDNHLDALVITHEHWDHLSGFKQARDVFDKLNVDEVWFAWTEDPDNALAKQLKNRQAVALNALAASAKKMDQSLQYTRQIKNVAAFFGVDGEEGSVKTKEALDWVKGKWKTHRYISPGEKPLTLKGLTGVRFFALGPPKDDKLINKSGGSVKKGEEYLDAPGDRGGLYLGADAVSLDISGGGLDYPFSHVFGREKGHPNIEEVNRAYDAEPWRTIDEDWRGSAGRLALQLDSHTNNTSLALAIELSEDGDVMLFPGDAQIGNWMSWDSLSWTGDGAGVTTEDLLKRTALYKVGHHCSHNATLRNKGLESMSSRELKALIPVKCNTSGWPIPHIPLLDRLKELAAGRVVLSDGGLPNKDGSGGALDRFVDSCRQTELFIDVTIHGGK